MFSFAASMKRPVSFVMSSSVSVPTAPKSTRPTAPACVGRRMFAGCGSPWKKPCRKIIVIHASVIRYASSRRSSSVVVDEVDVGELDPVDPFERQHPGPRVLPVDLRHADVRVAREMAVEVLRVARLLPVVELLADRARELVHELAGVDEVERADPLAREPRRLVEQAEVGLDLPRRARPLHLDRDAAPVRQGRAMHLADRRGRDRRGLEVEEQPLERVAELLLDHALGLLERERPHVVLQPAQLDDDVGRHDVGPRREELPELDERRPELVEHLAQVLAARETTPPCSAGMSARRSSAERPGRRSLSLCASRK